jgi:FkbM family methyltransferase
MNFSIPYCPARKYNFKSVYDQFGSIVKEDFTDQTEIILIKEFENRLKEYLSEINYKDLSMIELGSNQAYYSCLFYHMVKNAGKNPEILLVEPNDEHMKRGLKTLEKNKMIASLCNSIIGDYDLLVNNLDASSLPGGSDFILRTNKEVITLEQLILDYGFEAIDVLHMDVDHSEYSVLVSGEKNFRDKDFGLVFISTHSPTLHEKCDIFMTACGYKKTLEVKEMIVGYDSLLVFKR